MSIPWARGAGLKEHLGRTSSRSLAQVSCGPMVLDGKRSRPWLGVGSRVGCSGWDGRSLGRAARLEERRVDWRFRGVSSTSRKMADMDDFHTFEMNTSHWMVHRSQAARRIGDRLSVPSSLISHLFVLIIQRNSLQQSPMNRGHMLRKHRNLHAPQQVCRRRRPGHCMSASRPLVQEIPILHRRCMRA